MAQKLYLVCFILVLAGMRCRPSTEEITLPFERDKMVLTGFLSPAEPINIGVFALQPPLSQRTNEPIKNAVVVCIEEDTPVETLRYDEVQKRYVSTDNFTPKAGKRYSVKVSAPDYQTAQSEPEQVLPLPDFRRIQLIDTVIDGIKTARIELESTMPLGPYLTEWAFLPGTLPNQTYLFSLKGDFICLNQENYSGANLNIKSLTCKTPPIYTLTFDGQYYPPAALKANAVAVSVGTASKAFFEYHTSFQAQLSNGSPLFSSAGPIKSNVRNGYGLVAAHSVRRFEFRF